MGKRESSVIQKIRKSKFANVMGSMLGLIALIILFSFMAKSFLTVNNVISIALSVAIYATLACGISFVLIIGGAELSAGSVVGFIGALFAVMLGQGIPAGLCIVLGITGGALCGLFNGFLVTKMHLIPFIATLGTQYIFRGAAYLVSGGGSISVREAANENELPFLKYFGSGKILGYIPTLVIIMAVCAVVLTIVLSKTTFGRKVFATGSNVEAARLSGIRVQKITTLAYMISGAMAGLAGVMLTTRLMSAQPTAGMSYELEGIAASVIGGVSMMGGQGTIPGAVMGAFVIGVMRNGLNLVGVNNYWQQVIMGGIIIVAVWADIMRREKEASKK